MIQETPIVDGEKRAERLTERRIDRRRAKRARHELGRAVADHRDDRLDTERRRAVRRQQLVGAFGQIQTRVDERAVEVEDDEGHGGFLIWDF